MKTDPTQPFATVFDIPAEHWSATDMIQSETMRARRRRYIRRELAIRQWRALKRAGVAHRCDRYVVAVGVAYPRMHGVTPSFAAETVKPIVDAGTDAGLWPDDDATHRCCTVYYQLPEPAPRGHYLLNVLILPVPMSRPKYQPTEEIARAAAATWDGMPAGERPDGYGGYRSIHAVVPNRLWITSNITDSDLLAIQKGARRSRKWGSPAALGVREKVSDGLERLLVREWRRNPHWPVERYAILAGIAYAPNVDVDDADPDNAAESVNVMLRAGLDPTVDAWDGTDGRRCKAIGFYRWPKDCRPGTHEIHLTVLPVPDGFHILTALKGSWEGSWREHEKLKGAAR